ncbi:aldo/keto reductase [Neptunitalea lumnitzerae]|uniref:L-fucose dehydrogenase n=1 Tax=Neptunitalea lumnitzerae TaxID=2965509 RepID=A0ABQ5MM85_9FLAO|nr:aldo/keto reductase [Neptunitalea sp. Y10]GLB50426.1 L-fucose dehydrogenase [Neptunitalea sp. Y10]
MKKNSRRDFITKTAMASAAIAATPFANWANNNSLVTNTENQSMSKEKLNFTSKHGIGGVGFGNGWHENSNQQIEETLDAAWNSGVRYFDTSPWYGLGLSERRLGHYLFDKKREDYILSTKVGRILEPNDSFTPNPDLLWKGRLNFKHRYDYTADGVRRSVEDSLHRIGLSSIDVVFVHDLSPGNDKDLGGWEKQFEIAQKGAFPELTKMREEGIIKAWGMGVNEPDPILKCLEVADPDIMLVAIQYSLVYHKQALNETFPAMDKKNVKAVIGGPINAGFLANRERFNYGGDMPKEMVKKRDKINDIVKQYNVDLRTVALQFCAAHPTVSSVIPGASLPEQAIANAKSFDVKVPADLWAELKDAKLIEQNAPV